jgi:hypothetical protein
MSKIFFYQCDVKVFLTFTFVVKILSGDSGLLMEMVHDRCSTLLTKKWWVESDFKAPNLPLPLRLKGSGCYYNSIYNNTGTE